MPIPDSAGPYPYYINVHYTDPDMQRKFQTYFTVNINHAVVFQSLVIISYPAKMEYNLLDTIDYSGLFVLATYSDGSTQDITSECVLDPPEGHLVDSTGFISVLLYYEGEFRTSFDIIATAKSDVQSIEVVSPPTKFAYETGETMDYSGFAAIAEMTDGTERDITADCTFEPPQGYLVQSAGAIIVELFYKGELWQQFEMTATGESVIAGGDWWTLYDTGLLRIYCKGDMPSTPWNIDEDEYRDLITSVEMSDGVTSIGDFAFFRCSRLTSVTIPDSVTSIGDFAFFRCSRLTSVTIPDSVTSIGERAFVGCQKLTSITIPDNVTTIGFHAFEECGALTSIIIPDSVTSIGDGAFVSCHGLTSVTFGNGVTSIGVDTFYGCRGLTSVTIPDNVTTIRYRAFFYSTNLTSIIIPDSVTSIGDGAFESCYSLRNVYYSGTQAQWEAIEIENGNSYLTRNTIHYQMSA